LPRWEEFVKTITEPAATVGVFSMSRGDICGLDEQLLWSHYAADHTGVCLTYQIPYSFVDNLIGCAQVSYGEERLFQALASLDLTGRLDFETGIKPVITSFLTTKARHWSYEKEVRFLSFSPGPVQFERAWLKQICFGLNTPAAVRAEIMERVQKLGYPDCTFVELRHSQVDLFALEAHEVDG
jgi:hypothetical protein